MTEKVPEQETDRVFTTKRKENSYNKNSEPYTPTREYQSVLYTLIISVLDLKVGLIDRNTKSQEID